MALKQIRLELARMPDHPEGDANHGYEFIAPLTKDGQLDAAGWKEYGQACTVRRFLPDGDDEHGSLIRTRGGVWVFSYRPGEDDDEPIFRFGAHVFATGEYLTITEHDGVARTFRVVWVREPPAFRH